MPISIATFGSGGIEGAPKPAALTKVKAEQWLKGGGYVIPDALESVLLAFLANKNTRYGFLQYGEFLRDLLTYACDATVDYHDALSGGGSSFRCARTAALSHLIQSTQRGVCIPLPDNFATPKDLFGLSVLLGTEIGILSNVDGQLFLVSGVHGKVNLGGAGGERRFLLHTHPTSSDWSGQVKDDLTKPKKAEVEIVVTEFQFIFYTKAHLFNKTAARRGEPVVQPRDDLPIERDTRLTRALFANIERTLLAELALEERGAGQAAAAPSAAPAAPSDLDFLNFL